VGLGRCGGEVIADGVVLDNARQMAGISVTDLWLRYVTIGGTATREEVGRMLRGEREFGAPQYDVFVHALNERFVELDMDHPIPYAKDA
jgi:hypothetical protein